MGPYVELFNRLYREVENYRFTRLEPWTLFEIPSLRVVVAGLNSTIHESHREEDHHGFLGERQLRWFANKLTDYERKGWLRIGLVHHNAVRRPSTDDENLQDADDLRGILGEHLHVLLHGHSHQGRLEMLGPSLPVLSTGSAAVGREHRPGPTPDQPGEMPNQYQLVRLTRDGLWCVARQYAFERKRWIGDTRVSKNGGRWWDSLERSWSQVDATFPPEGHDFDGHRVYGAAVGRARIVVSSRTEHFLSSDQVADLMAPSSPSTTQLGGLLERVQRRLVLEIHKFERDDVAMYLRRLLGEDAGHARFSRLANIHDLVGLACNPRMLGFLVDIPEDKLDQPAGMGGSITSDVLYRMVVDEEWLAAEAKRLNPPGAAPGPSANALRDAATNLALQLWRDPAGSIRAEEVGTHAGDLLASMCDNDPDWTASTARVRTLLTRDDRGRITFIHQTVLEWLVAGRLAEEIADGGPPSHLDVGRLNTFMVGLLRARLGEEALARWAEAQLTQPHKGTAIENARDVLKHLNREASAPAILRDQDLRGQEFGGQSLLRAIFDGSDLTGARLVQRNLTGASLVGTQLAYVDFTEACLQDTDLTGANLSFARFHRTDLRGARLTGARLTGASFVGARAVPALVDASAVGAALGLPSSADVMYAQAIWGRCHVAISPDGTVLATGHDDGTIRLWDCARGRLLRALVGHHGSVFSVAFSPDGKTLASGADDATVRLWNMGDGTEQKRLAEHGGRVWSVAFSPDGETLASGAADGTVRLWDVAHGIERTRMTGHLGSVWSVAFSPDGKTLASTADKSVRLWNATDGSEQMRLVGHSGRVVSVAFSPTARRWPAEPTMPPCGCGT